MVKVRRLWSDVARLAEAVLVWCGAVRTGMVWRSRKGTVRLGKAVRVWFGSAGSGGAWRGGRVSVRSATVSRVAAVYF